MQSDGNTQAFQLRWRVKDGKVLLWKRHIRALSHYEFTPALIAWIYERLEWAAGSLLAKDADAVLLVSVDPQAEIQVSVEDTCPLPECGLDDVIVVDGVVRGLKLDEAVPASTVWLVNEDDELIASAGELFTAVDTLAEQLASTQGFTVQVTPQKRAALDAAKAAFALSDEFGFIALKGSSEPAEVLAKNLAALFG